MKALFQCITLALVVALSTPLLSRAADPADPVKTRIEVKVEGSQGDDGTYSAELPNATCSCGLTSENSFGNQYSVGKKDKGLSSLQLILDSKDDAKSGTTHFLLAVNFGKLFGGHRYEIDTREEGKSQIKTKETGGSGKVTLTESGGKSIAKIDAVTKDGVKITATLTCLKVKTVENGQLIEK